MSRLMLSAFQSLMPAQLNVRQIMPPSENFLKYALVASAMISSLRNCES